VSTQALLATKQRQYGIAAAHGMPVPATQFVRSPEEVSAFGAGARFPCLLKPLHCRQWERVPPSHPFYFRKVVVVSTAGELEANYELSSQIDPQVVVQEVIEGPDTAKLVYLSCYGVSGERLGACLVREVRTAPIYFGSASLVVPMHDPDVDALCDGFLRSIGYSGLCEIELKRDSRDGCVRMIEANPRYSVTADAAPYLGVDLGWLHYLNLIGQPVAPISQKSRDLRHIVLVRDFSCFRDYLRAGLLTWGQLIQSYRRPVVFFDFDLRDWRVTAATCVTLLRLLLGPPLRRFFPKRVAPAPSGPAGR
jgi:D-aspartate ligase